MILPKIDVIYFDLGHVLIHVNHERAIRKLAERMNLGMSEIQTVLEEKQDHFIQLDKGLVTPEEFVNCLTNEYKHITLDEFSSLYTDIFELDDNVASLIIKLACNYRLSVISNTNQLHYDKILRDYNRIMQYFENPITSHESHMLKPDAEIYHYALEKLKCQPQNAIFIDDKIENVNAAQKLGMWGIHFTGSEQLLIDLKKLNIQL